MLLPHREPRGGEGLADLGSCEERKRAGRATLDALFEPEQAFRGAIHAVQRWVIQHDPLRGDPAELAH